MGGTSLWIALVMTVIASTACSIGKALQKEATRHLPKFAVEEKILRQYLGNKTWVVGLVSDVFGGIIQGIAFALAPISLIQPVTGIGLVGLAIFSHFYQNENLKMWEWIAVALAGVGAIGLGASTSDDGGTHVDTTEMHRGPGALRMLSVLVLTGWGIASLSSLRKKKRDSNRRSGIDKYTASLYGLQAGGCFGLSAACCRTGFLMAERQRWTWAPFGIMWSIFLSSNGFVLQTKGLKEGATVVVCTCVAVTSIVTGVIIGLLGLGEGMPSSWMASIIRFNSWLMILVGVSLLAGGPGTLRDALAIGIQRLPPRFWNALPAEAAVKLKGWVNSRSGLPEITIPQTSDGSSRTQEDNDEQRNL